jgi:hypothetical protein
MTNWPCSAQQQEKKKRKTMTEDSVTLTLETSALLKTFCSTEAKLSRLSCIEIGAIVSGLALRSIRKAGVDQVAAITAGNDCILLVGSLVCSVFPFKKTNTFNNSLQLGGMS